MFKLGATEAEVAEELGCAVKTLRQWSVKHEAFGQALRVGKDVADERVIRTLFAMAVGYKSPATRVMVNPRTGRVIEHHFEEFHPPSPSCAMFWLANRREEWRRKNADGEPLGAEEAAQLARAAVHKAMATVQPAPSGEGA